MKATDKLFIESIAGAVNVFALTAFALLRLVQRIRLRMTLRRRMREVSYAVKEVAPGLGRSALPSRSMIWAIG